VALAAAMLNPDGDTRIAAQELIWSRRTFNRWTEVLALLAGVLVQDHGPAGAQVARRWIQTLADQHAAPAGDPGDLGLALALRSLAEVGESLAHPQQAALAGLATELATRWAHALIAECRRYDGDYAIQHAARYQRLRALA